MDKLDKLYIDNAIRKAKLYLSIRPLLKKKKEAQKCLSTKN